MKAVLESLSDPFWLVGSGILATCAIAFVLMVRSPEVRLSREKQRLGTRLILLLATFCWLLLSTGVLLLWCRSPRPRTDNIPHSSYRVGSPFPLVTVLYSETSSR